MKRFRWGVILAAVMMVGWTSEARADIIFSTAQGSLQPDENVLFGCASPCIIEGLTVIGETNNTGAFVKFTSDESLTATAGGQAKVDSTDLNGYDNILIDAYDPFQFFSEFETNVILFATTSGLAVVTACNQFAVCENFNLAVDAGENFFVLSVISPQLINTILITSDVAIMTLKQPRVSMEECLPGNPTCEDITVPEPATMALLGMGLLAGGWRLRRKFSRA